MGSTTLFRRYDRRCLQAFVIILVFLALSFSMSKHHNNEKEANYEVNENTFIKRSELTSTNETFEVHIIPGLMDLINPQSTKYVLNISYHLENKNLCLSEKFLTVLIIILSASDNIIRRNVIRETWGNTSLYSKYGNVKVMFLLGKNKDNNFQKNIDEEFKQHGDILQGRFMDSYRNLSHKTVMGLKWITERCKNARYILKTDDDVVLNTFRVLKTGLLKMDVNHFHVQCMRFTHFRVRRSKKEQLYIEANQLKGMVFQVPFCQGQYVLFLNAIVPSLYKAAINTPFFWVDDQFSYGFVMNQIPSLQYKLTLSEEYLSYLQFKTGMCRKVEMHCLYWIIAVRSDAEIKDCWFDIIKLNSNF